MREYEINLKIKTKNRKVVDKLQSICDSLPNGEYYSMESNSTPLKSELPPKSKEINVLEAING